jgi:hypothetical protein
VGERCLNGKALAREGRYVGEGQRCAGTAVDAPTAVGKGNITVFFLRNHVMLKVERRRPVGPDHWAGPGTSRPDRTRLDRRSCASIIVTKSAPDFHTDVTKC